MAFLHFLQSIRFPVLDKIMFGFTRFGEETLFIIAGMFLLWCVDKKEGYFVLSCGFFGMICNQFLKIACRIARPWVVDPAIKPYGPAIPGAEGYSFTSGHTQSSIALYGGVARYTKRKALRIVLIIFAVLIPFSRMYLGVHTPEDVIVAAATSLLCVFCLYPVIKSLDEHPEHMWPIILLMLVLSFGYLFYVSFHRFPADTDAVNYAAAVKNGYTLLGCSLAFTFSYYMDVKVSRFDTKAVWWVQIIKFAVGALLVFGVKEGLKIPLDLIFGENPFKHLIRYFFVVGVAGGLWPMSFKYLAKSGKKD